MKKIFLSLMLFFFAVQSCFPLPGLWSRRNISMLDGLPTNTVRSIVQDKDGFIWMGTDNGLCRYDGYNVLLYHNSRLGHDQYVSAMALLGDRLLVGSSHGAFVLDIKKRRFEVLDRRLVSLVSAFAVDAGGNVWVATRGQGVFCCHPGSGSSTRYTTIGGGVVDDIFADNANQIWAISRARGQVYHFNKARRTFDVVPLHGFTRSIEGLRMAQGPEGSVLKGTWTQGVLRLHRDGTVTQLVPPVVSGRPLHIRSLYNDASGHVYLGCEEGLVSYDFQTGAATVVTGSGNAPTSERFVYAVVRDREGGLWMGTFYGGVTYFSSMGERFVSLTSDGNRLRGSVVSRFCESAGKVWIATDDGGLSCYDGQAGGFVDFPGREALSGMNVHGLWADGSTLWVGTYGNGLVRLVTATGAMKPYKLEGQPGDGSCYAVMRDSHGRLWAATMENACLYDAAADSFRLVRRFGSLTVDIEEDHAGNVWFATQGGGLWRLSPRGQWRQYGPGTRGGGIGDMVVNCVREGFGNRLFVATNSGLYEFVSSTDSFRRVRTGSTEQCYMGLVFNDDEMWLTANTELVRLVPGGRTEIYNRYDGLLAGPWQPNACMMASDGRVWLGCVNGINTFYPYQIRANRREPTAMITAFYLPDRTRADLDSLSATLSYTKRVDLGASDNMFTIQFSALSYVSPLKNRYQYMLEGFDDQWVDAGTEHKAMFTNLPAGTYTFRVRACNNDGLWSSRPAELTIVIHPPFYWSLPAKVVYLALVLLLLWLIIRRKNRKAERRHQLELKMVNERKEQEMREARLRFFTMIAHEIRTPVTLIIGPLEKLKEQLSSEAHVVGSHLAGGTAAAQTLDVIDRNAHRLLDLVNQLLDYNKVKQQGMKLNFTVCNMAQLMRAVAVRFEPTLSQRGIKFEVCYPDDNFTAMVDGEAVTKILSNFMTNAGKYARTTIRMACGPVTEQKFQLSVSDDGPGMSREDQTRIFDVFYQAKDNKPGTGIGLNTVKLLTEAHHGRVEVTSALGQGSVFTVTLPVRQHVPVAEQSAAHLPVRSEGRIPQPDDDEPAAGVAGKSRPVMLVVDDDDDMRNFIASSFSGDYTVLTAADGNDGLQKLKQAEVGVIVSDWMMPGMDGAEFCRCVRQSQDTSHILFIMLTAKTDDDSKTEGMKIGADAYIEKPFSMNYLEACIRNLLSRRRLLMEKFANTPTEPITRMANNPVDDELLNKMNEIIEDNLDNPELNVNLIADRLHISRSSLFVKIKALTCATPNEMIQVVRLRRAAQLLREGEHNVSEVAFLVGFNSASYFAKCFQKQFGVRPSEFT